MPVNYQQIQSQIQRLGDQEIRRSRELAERTQRARELLERLSNDGGIFRERMQAALEADRYLRCAIPPDEDPLLPVHVSPEPAACALLAADGSQIFPNPHDAVYFGLVNVGVFRWQSGDPLPPRETTVSVLLSEDDLLENGGGEDAISLRRDVQERSELVRLAAAETLPVVALTDGLLEFFRQPGDAGPLSCLAEKYVEELAALKGSGGIPAGYVDRPRADLVVRLLEIGDVDLPPGAYKDRPLGGVADAALFSRILTRPGDRSALFGIQSTATDWFKGDCALHFFYFNAGAPGQPWLARVEITDWVAKDSEKLSLLQAMLFEQVRILSPRPYPYALARAHEIAVVRMDERREVEAMVQTELTRRGIAPGSESNKQAFKLLEGKKRFSR